MSESGNQSLTSKLSRGAAVVLSALSLNSQPAASQKTPERPPITRQQIPKLLEGFKTQNFTLEQQLFFLNKHRFDTPETWDKVLSTISPYLHPKILLMERNFDFKHLAKDTQNILPHLSEEKKVEMERFQKVYELMKLNPKLFLNGSEGLKTYREMAIWAHRIFENLLGNVEFDNISPKIVEEEYFRIKTLQEKHSDFKIFGPNTQLIVFSNNERQPGPGVRSFAPGSALDGIDQHIESQIPIKRIEKSLYFLSETVDTPHRLVSFFSGHGHTENSKNEQKASFYFTNGEQLKDGKIKPGDNIDSEKIANAYIKRYENQQIEENAYKNPEVLLFDACYLGNMGQEMQKYFDIENKKRISLGKKALPPLIIISSGETDEFTAYYGNNAQLYGSEFIEKVLIKFNPLALKFETPFITDAITTNLDYSKIKVQILNLPDANNIPKRTQLGEIEKTGKIQNG